jgi:hypothetical protein
MDLLFLREKALLYPVGCRLLPVFLWVFIDSFSKKMIFYNKTNINLVGIKKEIKYFYVR